MAKDTDAKTQPVYAAAERFVDQALRRDGSLFTPSRAIWTLENARDLHKRFVEAPDLSKASFVAKLENQLAGAPPDTIQLAAELIYVHFSIAANIGGAAKRRLIDDLLELTARHFVSLVLRLIDVGMYRAYADQTENRTAIRGRIAFAEDVRTNYALRHRTVCEYSELTWDIPENQVIRQVLRLLAAQPTFSRSLRNDLRSADASMYDVSEGRLRSSDLDRFQYQRFNVAYEPVHRLCRLFLEGASLSEELGSFDKRAFLVDMNTLFERFVTRVLQTRCPPGMRVRDQVRLHLDEERTIPIRPDLVVQAGRTVVRVADCKYKPARDDFRSSDVYQLLAYCTVTGAQEGVLIYPRTELPFDTNKVRIHESRVSVCQIAVDLGVGPDEWQDELDLLIGAVLEPAAPELVEM